MKPQVKHQLLQGKTPPEAPAPSPRHQRPRVHDLERQRVERIAQEIAPALQAAGSVIVDVGSLENVDRWRMGARRAGRLLGWSVRTGFSRDGRRVWACSDDWTSPTRR